MFKAHRAEPAHEISYAYGTSLNAGALGFGDTGCYVFETELTCVGVPTYAQAKQLATDAKTNPTRWSLDHPENADMLKHFLGNAKATQKAPA